MRILATTDLHAQLVPWDFYADRSIPGRGLSCLAIEIAKARAEAGGALLFDNGDFLTGNPLADEAVDHAGAGMANPMVRAMNHLRYDAVGLGNHEFSRGLDYLAHCLAEARFPVVAANIRRADGGPAYLPHVMITAEVTDTFGARHGLRVAVTSALPPQTMIWEKYHLSGRLQIGDILAALRVQVRQMRAAGADLVVVLAHSGVAPEGGGSTRMRANVAQAVAGLAGVDVVVAGHTHDALPAQPVAAQTGAALVLPGALASHLGVVDLDMGLTRGRWRVLGHRCELRAVAPVEPGQTAPEDAYLVSLGSPALARIRRQLDTVVGRAQVRLDTHFALIGRSRALHFVGRAVRDHMAGVLGAGGADLPVLAAVAATRTGGRGGAANYALIPPGPVRERDLGSIMPFDDRLAATEICGVGVMRWLDHAAAIFRQVAPGAQDAPLVDPEVPGFLFDAIEGLSYRIDLSMPPGPGRVRDLEWQGRAVRATDRFILATSSHRMGGGGGFPLPSARREIALPPTRLRDILREAARQPIGAQQALCPVWSFCPMPGTSVVLDTAAEAISDLDDLVSLGSAPGGFQRFRLHL
ncbi:bifunctional metallophosphatase/5'-nucleotidase [Fuscibacter oryzae]|uniref:5'-nucleotidase C-terminal domain-containing protein n=1 Tax=Fuscibacter oryzae TaxID=2803939 RepID=A0A8J7MQH0_9RHOB|nr:5'-nucleotidase C-terminal domain-containing protein [Fuscibacter oryzae]MBL4926558.1 5'-nucleotidase C-terminal domain-containing protein [Fuscibacter oryzae]